MFRALALRIDSLIADVCLKVFTFGSVPSICAVTSNGSQFPISVDPYDVLKDHLLLAVPKHKTATWKKKTRRFAPTRTYKPVTDLLTCQVCGHWHPVGTICPDCYAKVRTETERIKLELLNYNPYVNEYKHRESVVRYGENDPERTAEFWQGKRVLEMERERPSWFSDNLTKRWNGVIDEVDTQQWQQSWENSKEKKEEKDE